VSFQEEIDQRGQSKIPFGKIAFWAIKKLKERFSRSNRKRSESVEGGSPKQRRPYRPYRSV
jgi:hypothetical protein